MSEARTFERLEQVKFQRREYHPVGTTRTEMQVAMEWVRSLGHEAASLEDDGFRYRSIYATPSEYTGRVTSGWKWAEPGEWLMHMVGDGQDPELDDPHEAPDDDWFGFHGDDWHEITADSEATR